MKALPHSSNEKFKHILASMRADNVKLTIENDRMLNIMGERLFQKHVYQESAHQLFCSNLRDIAKLIIELQKPTNIKSSEEAVNPALFTNILLAARNLCGQELTTGIVKHPAKGLKLGTRFQALIDAVESTALEKQQPSVNVVQKSCSDIRRLFQLRWNLEFTGNVRRSMQDKVKNKIRLVPLASDVKKLSGPKCQYRGFPATTQQGV